MLKYHEGDFKFNIGDRVLYKGEHTNYPDSQGRNVTKIPCIIDKRNEYGGNNIQYQVIPIGTQGLVAFFERDLELDIQWYRDNKINKILV